MQPAGRLTARAAVALLVRGVAAILMLVTPSPGTADDARKPARIVSLNLCTDELVLRLADRSNIASVTWLATTSSVSSVTDLAAQIPVNHGIAEEVVPLNPDLVVAGIYTARPAVALLKRTGFRVLDLDVPNSFDEIRAQYREVGRALGEEERAERLIAEMDSRLAAIAVRPAQARPRALVFNPNGYTVSRGTLRDDIITRAGLENVSATLGVPLYEQISLETLVVNAPDILILNSFRGEGAAMATEMLRHPVLAKMSDRMRTAVLPGRMWACAGPGNIDAIELLSGVANEARRGETRE